MFIRCALLILSLCGFVLASSPVLIENSQVLTYAKEKLPHEGILKQTSDGFLYIELPKEYIFRLIPLISKEDLCPPPYFGEGKVGAHITVAMPGEMTGIKSATIPYLGKKISFSILCLEKVNLEKSVIGSEVYFLTIESSQIAEIRKRLGLPPKIKNYDFHITIGVNCP